jgi:hypothetical protein
MLAFLASRLGNILLRLFWNWNHAQFCLYPKRPTRELARVDRSLDGVETCFSYGLTQNGSIFWTQLEEGCAEGTSPVGRLLEVTE